MRRRWCGCYRVRHVQAAKVVAICTGQTDEIVTIGETKVKIGGALRYVKELLAARARPGQAVTNEENLIQSWRDRCKAEAGEIQRGGAVAAGAWLSRKTPTKGN